MFAVFMASEAVAAQNWWSIYHVSLCYEFAWVVGQIGACMLLQTMLTSNELPSNVCCKYFYFTVFTVIRGMIFTFFWVSIVYNDMFNSLTKLTKMPFEEHKDWTEHKNFVGDSKNWI
jgi:hypothetical protein